MLTLHCYFSVSVRVLAVHQHLYILIYQLRRRACRYRRYRSCLVFCFYTFFFLSFFCSYTHLHTRTHTHSHPHARSFFLCDSLTKLTNNTIKKRSLIKPPCNRPKRRPTTSDADTRVWVHSKAVREIQFFSFRTFQNNSFLPRYFFSNARTDTQEKMKKN